ncbi:hypothetical protein QFC19_001031 [Naganishia cerealis]|uniref:Uncharacterized protein n=1 Tax=Naganishia cerealis TaxID=610337 RepID=A0ACC2WKR0_9TREE|nr:hypothetical protein QFC19_001031 [Naganishia cerealis]
MDTDEQSRKRPYPGPEKTRESLLAKLTIKPWLESLPRGVVLTNAHVVDPAKSRLLDGVQTVVIKNGKVHTIQSSESKAVVDTSELPVVDLKGAYICPYVEFACASSYNCQTNCPDLVRPRGLIDCHVHVTAVPGVKTMAEAVRIPEEVIHYRSSYVLKG